HEVRGLLGDRVIDEDWHEPHSALRSDGIQTRRLPALVRYDFVGARRQEAPPPDEDKADELAAACHAASRRARALGHDLRPWMAPSCAALIGGRTVCNRCGCADFVRSGCTFG